MSEPLSDGEIPLSSIVGKAFVKLCQQEAAKWTEKQFKAPDWIKERFKKHVAPDLSQHPPNYKVLRTSLPSKGIKEFPGCFAVYWEELNVAFLVPGILADGKLDVNPVFRYEGEPAHCSKIISCRPLAVRIVKTGTTKEWDPVDGEEGTGLIKFPARNIHQEASATPAQARSNEFQAKSSTHPGAHRFPVLQEEGVQATREALESLGGIYLSFCSNGPKPPVHSTDFEAWLIKFQFPTAPSGEVLRVVVPPVLEKMQGGVFVKLAAEGQPEDYWLIRYSVVPSGLNLLLNPNATVDDLLEGRPGTLYVAQVNGLIHILIFDRDGKRILARSVNNFGIPAVKLNELKHILDEFWRRENLTTPEKELIITLVTSLANEIPRYQLGLLVPAFNERNKVYREWESGFEAWIENPSPLKVVEFVPAVVKGGPTAWKILQKGKINPVERIVEPPINDAKYLVLQGFCKFCHNAKKRGSPDDQRRHFERSLKKNFSEVKVCNVRVLEMNPLSFSEKYPNQKQYWLVKLGPDWRELYVFPAVCENPRQFADLSRSSIYKLEGRYRYPTRLKCCEDQNARCTRGALEGCRNVLKIIYKYLHDHRKNSSENSGGGSFNSHLNACVLLAKYIGQMFRHDFRNNLLEQFNGRCGKPRGAPCIVEQDKYPGMDYSISEKSDGYLFFM
jgi:hypothetical protein